MIITMDVETEPILPRPFYPPKLSGIAIKRSDEEAVYITDTEEAKAAVGKAIKEASKIVFHNGKFDTDVIRASLGIEIPHEKYEDTLFLAYLNNPNAESLALKDLGTSILGMPADERDEVVEWLVSRQPIPGVKLSPSKKSDKYAGAYVAYAPKDIVAKYAKGDVIRTELLYKALYPNIVERGMQKAYDVEKELMWILQENEAKGVRVDVEALKADIAEYSNIYAGLQRHIATLIGLAPGEELKVSHKLMERLVANGLADVNKIELSPSGVYKSDKATMAACITNKALSAAMEYCASLHTCLGTFMKPWLGQALETGGTIHTNWSQTKQGDSDTRKGTRTGRLSSSPNFQNMPKEFKEFFNVEGAPDWPLKDIAYRPLPLCRKYILPDEGCVLVNRDYSQQEIRVFAHFAGGEICKWYTDDPWVDLHDFAGDVVYAVTGLRFKRKPIKTINLGLMYGMGIALLLEKVQALTDIPLTIALMKQIKDAIISHIPGWKEMNAEMKRRGRNNIPIRTWLGRLHYCEEPQIIKGVLRTFDYKMVNTLVQGSSGDCTKVATIRANNVITKALKGARFLLQVHDELMFSVPKESLIEGMGLLKMAMESVEFDVPMLSEGKVGYNWKDMVEYDKKGEITWKTI